MSKEEEIVPTIRDGRMNVDLPGRYTWVLLHDLTGPYSRKETHTVRTFISRRSLRETLDRFTESDTVRRHLSRSKEATIKKISVSVKNETTFTHATEAVRQINSTDESKSEREETRTVERTFTIPSGERRSVYQLHFNAPGISLALDTFSDRSPLPPLNEVIVRCECELGDSTAAECEAAFAAVLGCMAHITPGRDNTAEWASIRKKCTELLHGLSPATTYERQAAFWEHLGKITPGRDNTAEWAAIRRACGEKHKTPKQHLFAMLDIFSRTSPGRDNKAEWAAIRKVCHKWKPTLIG